MLDRRKIIVFRLFPFSSTVSWSRGQTFEQASAPKKTDHLHWQGDGWAARVDETAHACTDHLPRSQFLILEDPAKELRRNTAGVCRGSFRNGKLHSFLKTKPAPKLVTKNLEFKEKNVLVFFVCKNINLF